MKILVVFFSRSGHTRRVAKRIGKATQAALMALDESHQATHRPGRMRRLVSAISGFGDLGHAHSENPADYDMVVFGVPVRGAHLSSPVHDFAIEHAGSIRHCAFYCVLGGSDPTPVFAELERLLGHAPLATLVLTDIEIDNEQAGPKIDRFVAALSAPVARQA